MKTSLFKFKQPDGRVVYFGLLTAFGLIIISGYLVFRYFAVYIMPDFSVYTLLPLAVIAGVASFFSPCAFPLLPGYFSLYYSQTEQSSDTKLALSATLGVMSFTLILGIIIGMVGEGIAQGLSITGNQAAFTRTFRALIGGILILLGIGQWRGVNIKPMVADALAWRTRPRHEETIKRPLLNLYLYGFGYNAAGMGCTAPILTGLMIFAASSGGFASAFLAFVVFAFTMGSLMLLISMMVAVSEEVMIQKFRSATTRIKKVSSILLMGVGVFNIITSIAITTFTRIFFP